MHGLGKDGPGLDCKVQTWQFVLCCLVCFVLSCFVPAAGFVGARAARACSGSG